MINIDEFADKKGIARNFIDATNVFTTILPQSRLAALGAMGYPVHDIPKLEEIALREERQFYERIIEPVLVIRDGDKPFIFIKTKASLSSEATILWKIEKEDGSIIQDKVLLEEIEIADYKVVQGVEYDIRRFICPFLPHGYHKFSCIIEDNKDIYKSKEMSLIFTPVQCYKPREMVEGKKIWGVSVQLYSLRSKYNWGVGDFHDLSQLLTYIARAGGHFVGLNPLHAGYPANPDPDMVSPYSPSSRKWLNIVYIHIEDIPEFIASKEALAFVKTKEFIKELKELRDCEYVNYRKVLDLKLKVLKILFNSFRVDDKRSNRGKKFLEFLKQGGQSLIDMATFDALQAYFYAQGINAWGWPAFPKEYQKASLPFVEAWRKKHEAEVRFYCYLQFIAAEQLENAFLQAKKEGMLLGTYRDLAVGVSEGSSDIWADPDNIFRGKTSVGAPPDVLGPQGQSWGLPPMDPAALYETGYREFIDLYKANMKSCGALRIDHAAGLYRMWWVPPENRPTNGAYVAQPMHDLLGIIALESHRNKCLIIGEDLGTIPMELRVGLKEAGIYSYKLFFGERAWDGGFIAPKDYEPLAMSALTTHDMPTLKGWWNNYDLALGQELGVYSSLEAGRIGADRDNAKQRILDSLHGLCSVGSEVPSNANDVKDMTEDLVLGLEVHMCRGSCALFSSQLEDWIGVLKPVNVPGTFREYPNWRRKLTENLDVIFAKNFVNKLTKAMTEARDKVSVK